MGSLLSHSVTCCLRRYLLCCLNPSVWVVCFTFMPLNWFGWEWENGVNWNPGVWSFPLLYCVEKSVARNSVNVVRMEKKGLGQISTPGRSASLFPVKTAALLLFPPVCWQQGWKSLLPFAKIQWKATHCVASYLLYLKYPQLESRGEAMWRECWPSDEAVFSWLTAVFMGKTAK